MGQSLTHHQPFTFCSKAEARRARKMGHIPFIAPTLEQAQSEMKQACAILGIAP